MANYDKNTDKSNIRILESSSFIFYKVYFSWKRVSDKFEQEYFSPINDNFDDFLQCLKGLTDGREAYQ